MLPERIKVLVPPFVNAPLPLMPPLKVLFVVPLVIKLPAPSVTLPAPINAPIVSLLPFKSNVAPDAIVTSVLGTALAAVICSMPALILVTPL